MRRLTATVAVLVAVLTGGCGSSGPPAETTPRAETGTAVFNIAWPTEERLIPARSLSIRFEAYSNNSLYATVIVAKPNTTAKFTLPVGLARVVAVAYPTADGTGNAQAAGSVDFQVVSGQAVSKTITPRSTITSVKITPSSFTVAVGGTQQCSATAYDSTGSIVLVSESNAFTWGATVNDGGALGNIDVTSAGLVTGKTAGSCKVTAQEKESGVTGSASVTISGGGGGGGGGSGGGSGGTQDPEPVFFEYMAQVGDYHGTFTRLNESHNWGIRVSRRTFVFVALASQYKVTAGFFTPETIQAFLGGGQGSAYLLLDNKFGVVSDWIGAGTYYIAVRNNVSAANAYSLEVDTINADDPYGWTTSSCVKTLDPGTTASMPFTVASGTRVFVNGVNTGVQTYVIPADQLSRFQNHQSFTALTDCSYQEGGRLGYPLHWMFGAASDGEVKPIMAKMYYPAAGKYYCVAFNDTNAPHSYAAYTTSWSPRRAGAASAGRPLAGAPRPYSDLKPLPERP